MGGLVMAAAGGGAGPASGLMGGARPRAAPAGAAPGVAGRAADQAVTVLYRSHYAALVREAALLVGDVATAEDVVQDCFVALHRGWWRVRDTGAALSYLRRSVINKSRSVLRRRAVAGRHPVLPAPAQPSAEDSALAVVQLSPVRAALRALPVRQREVLVLRYYADLSETQIAAALGISRGSVKVHAARAKDALRAALAYSGLPTRPHQQ
jgi:RNA polymerase sigma-70 factor (sigma-E family)